MAKSPSPCVENESPVPQARRREKDLVERYRRAAPGSAAEGELVKKYLPLVKTVVGRVAMTLPAHVDVEDLYSVGMVGLLNALRNFDENNGASLETYARIRIRGAVVDELRRMDFIARSVRDKARKVQTVMQTLEQSKGEPPTEEEMAAALKISVTEYRELLDEIKPVTFVCLDAVHLSGADDDGGLQYESIADPSQENPVDGASRRELAGLITMRIQHLPDMQRKVLALYYFEDLRLREIAEAFGLTESRICQIHAQAILAIKNFIYKHEAQSGNS